MSAKTISFGVSSAVLGALILGGFGAFAQEDSANAPRLTEDQRAALHEAFQTGDTDEVDALLAEYGIEKLPGRFGHGEKRGPSEEEIAAIEAGDYEAWAALQSEESKLSEYINADNFDTFAAMHQALQDGDKEAASELRDELGLPERNGHSGPCQKKGSGGEREFPGRGNGVRNGFPGQGNGNNGEFPAQS